MPIAMARIGLHWKMCQLQLNCHCLCHVSQGYLCRSQRSLEYPIAIDPRLLKALGGCRLGEPVPDGCAAKVFWKGPFGMPVLMGADTSSPISTPMPPSWPKTAQLAKSV